MSRSNQRSNISNTDTLSADKQEVFADSPHTFINISISQKNEVEKTKKDTIMANKTKKFVNEDSLKAAATVGLMGVVCYLISDEGVKRALKKAVELMEKGLETTGSVTQKAKDFLG